MDPTGIRRSVVSAARSWITLSSKALVSYLGSYIAVSLFYTRMPAVESTMAIMGKKVRG